MQNLKRIKTSLKNKKFTIKDLIYCTFFILLCNVIGYLSSLFQTESLKTWYPTLTKSILTPPSFVFIFVWALLYALLGISTFLAFKDARKNDKAYILSIFSAQLCFNLLWSIFFFGIRAPFIAFIEILFLLGITLCMMKFYKRFNNFAYLLLYPYLIWIIFASYLNLVIVLKN